MAYQKVTGSLRDHLHIDKNSEGAIRISALVHDPENTFNLDLDPFYKTCVFYFYDSEEEAVENFFDHINAMGYIFVEEDDEWMMA